MSIRNPPSARLGGDEAKHFILVSGLVTCSLWS